MALFTSVVHVHVHVADLTAEVKRVADTLDAVLAKLNEETAPVIVGEIRAGAPTEQIQGA